MKTLASPLNTSPWTCEAALLNASISGPGCMWFFFSKRLSSLKFPKKNISRRHIKAENSQSITSNTNYISPCRIERIIHSFQVTDEQTCKPSPSHLAPKSRVSRTVSSAMCLSVWLMLSWSYWNAELMKFIPIIWNRTTFLKII